MVQVAANVSFPYLKLVEHHKVIEVAMDSS